MAVTTKGQQKSDFKICITYGLKIILFEWEHVGDVLCNFVLLISCALLYACFLHHRTFLCPPTEVAIYWLENLIYVTENVMILPFCGTPPLSLWLCEQLLPYGVTVIRYPGLSHNIW